LLGIYHEMIILCPEVITFMKKNNNIVITFTISMKNFWEK